MKPQDSTFTCAITGKTVTMETGMPCNALRPSLLKFIQKYHPNVSPDSWILRSELPALKASYVESALSEEVGEITDLEREVIESLKQNELISSRPADEQAKGSWSFGERLADRIATFGGSWTFILCFAAFLLLWILSNTLLLVARPPDPYPFILLNLILSCVAAMQAPVIMMSQNRQETRDRKRAEEDYQINLKAELEIRHLHEKVDHLLHHHSERLLEIQSIQTELLRQIVNNKKS